MDVYTLRQKTADYICAHFFDGKTTLKGKIINNLSVLDADTVARYYNTMMVNEKYINSSLVKKDKTNSFKYPYGRFCYLNSIINRLMKESKFEKQDQITQSKPIKASTQEKPAWMVELEADIKPPKVYGVDDIY